MRRGGAMTHPPRTPPHPESCHSLASVSSGSPGLRRSVATGRTGLGRSRCCSGAPTPLPLEGLTCSTRPIGVLRTVYCQQLPAAFLFFLSTRQTRSRCRCRMARADFAAVQITRELSDPRQSCGSTHYCFAVVQFTSVAPEVCSICAVRLSHRYAVWSATAIPFCSADML